jgi:hypothetical protein
MKEESSGRCLLQVEHIVGICDTYIPILKQKKLFQFSYCELSIYV